MVVNKTTRIWGSGYLNIHILWVIQFRYSGCQQDNKDLGVRIFKHSHFVGGVLWFMTQGQWFVSCVTISNPVYTFRHSVLLPTRGVVRRLVEIVIRWRLIPWSNNKHFIKRGVLHFENPRENPLNNWTLVDFATEQDRTVWKRFLSSLFPTLSPPLDLPLLRYPLPPIHLVCCWVRLHYMFNMTETRCMSWSFETRTGVDRAWCTSCQDKGEIYFWILWSRRKKREKKSKYKSLRGIRIRYFFFSYSPISLLCIHPSLLYEYISISSVILSVKETLTTRHLMSRVPLVGFCLNLSLVLSTDSLDWLGLLQLTVSRSRLETVGVVCRSC